MWRGGQDGRRSEKAERLGFDREFVHREGEESESGDGEGGDEDHGV